MPSTTGVSAVIQEIRTVSGNQPQMRRIVEKATQTFKSGAVVQMDTATGFVMEWDGTTVPLGILGVAKEFGASLATSGVALDAGVADVPNQPLAQTKYRPKFNDGKTGVVVANEDTIFYGQVGTTTVITDVGKQYGLTKDTDGHWYVDKAKVTVGTNTAVVIEQLDPNDTTRGVHFKFIKAVQQLAQ